MEVKLYGYGCYRRDESALGGWSTCTVYEQTGEIINDSGVVTNSTTNTVAQMTSILRGIQAISKKLTVNELLDTTIHIYSNYQGVEKWVTKEWRTNAEISIKYAEFMDKLINRGWKFRFTTLSAKESKKAKYFAEIIHLAHNAMFDYKRGINTTKNISSAKSVKLGAIKQPEKHEYIPKGQPVMLSREDEIDKAVEMIKNHKSSKKPINNKSKNKKNKKNKNKKNKQKNKQQKNNNVKNSNPKQPNFEKYKQKGHEARRREKQRQKSITKIPETTKVEGLGSITHNPDIFVI